MAITSWCLSWLSARRSAVVNLARPDLCNATAYVRTRLCSTNGDCCTCARLSALVICISRFEAKLLALMGPGETEACDTLESFICSSNWHLAGEWQSRAALCDGKAHVPRYSRRQVVIAARAQY